LTRNNRIEDVVSANICCVCGVWFESILRPTDRQNCFHTAWFKSGHLPVDGQRGSFVRLIALNDKVKD